MIATEQNTQKQLLRLAAQRQLYATAKKVFGVQVVLSGPVAIALSFSAMSIPALKFYAAMWGMMLLLCDLFWFTPWQKKLREKGARVQELFDCDVLLLPWNSIKADKRPDPELIREQAEKYGKWADKMPPLVNWYAPAVDSLPLYVGRLACQRSNCWWDSKQRRRYAGLIIAIILATSVVLLCLAAGNGFTIADFFLKVVAPLSPAFALGMRQFREQRETADRLDKLKDHTEQLWNDALNGRPEPEISADSRVLQDEIFENRKRSPLVFDTFFKGLRRDYEVQMNHGVDELVDEAKHKLHLS